MLTWKLNAVSMLAPRCVATLVELIWLWHWRGVANTTLFYGTTLSVASLGSAEPLQWRRHTKVVSTASCALLNSGKLFATISNWRLFCKYGTTRSMSLTNWLVVTRALTSRPFFAPALLTAKPHLLHTPALEHEQRGRGRRKRRKKST